MINNCRTSILKTLRGMVFTRLPMGKFCNMKSNQPNPQQDRQCNQSSDEENEESERTKQEYVRKYEETLRNAQDYKMQAYQLAQQIRTYQQNKRFRNDPFKKILDWITSSEKATMLEIQKLKNADRVNQRASGLMWEATVKEKTFIMSLQHKDMGVQMIQVSRLMNKLDLKDQETSFKEGVELTQRMLNQILHKYGFCAFKPKPKQKFNQQLHQEVGRHVAPQLKGSIIKVVEEGWKHYDSVLIPAKVILSE